jgi:hypothetical protein
MHISYLLNSPSWTKTSPLLAVSSSVQEDQAFIWYCKDLALPFLFPRLTSHKHTRMHNNSIVRNHPFEERWRERGLEFRKFTVKTWAAKCTGVSGTQPMHVSLPSTESNQAAQSTTKCSRSVPLQANQNSHNSVPLNHLIIILLHALYSRWLFWNMLSQILLRSW